MSGFGYQCHKAYGCLCPSGKIVSYKTAERHRKNAQKRLDEFRSREFLPVPIQVSLEDEITMLPRAATRSTGTLDSNNPDIASAADILEFVPSLNHDCDVDSIFKDEDCSKEIEFDIAEEERSVRIAETLKIEEEDSSDRTSKADEDDINFLPEDESTGVGHAFASVQALGAHIVPFQRGRFGTFMAQYGWMVGYAIKHNCTREAMDDLLQKNGGQTGFKSWNGVKKAL